MKITRKIVAVMAVFLLILQILGTSLCLAKMDGKETHEASLTGKIYDRGVDTDHNGKFDYLEVSVEINVTAPGEYRIELYGLTDSNYYFISANDYASAYLGAGIHLLNLSLYGPTIYASGRNPAYVQYIGLLIFREYQLFTKFFGIIDSREQVNLTRVYSYNEFDAPFKDIETRIIVNPDGQVHFSGALNYTHMEPPNEMIRTRGNARIETNGNVTSASTNCTFTVPPESASEFPYNSTSFSWLEEYSNKHYSMGANATVTLPVSTASEFPFNATDLSLKSTYSKNGLLTTEINASAILPKDFASQFLLNATDFTIQGQYLANTLSGVITVHILSGFPLGDVNIDFQGNTTDLFLTGNVIVIYNIPTYPLNKTTLEQMLLYLNSTIPGHGPGSLYEMTNGTLDCPYLDTKMTPYDSTGANVVLNASIHGDFMRALIDAILGYSIAFEGGITPQTRELAYSALNATVSSVKSASFQVAYTHASKEISIRLTFVNDFLNLVKDLSALAEEILFYPLYPPLYQPPYPPEMSMWFSESFSPNTTTHSTSLMMMMSLTWVYGVLGSVMFLNATLPYVEDAKIELTYASASKKLELKLTAQAEFLEEVPPIPEEVFPEIRELIESLHNTTYCTLKSSRESIVYENGVANLKVNYVIEGDLNAEINFVKNTILTYMNKTSPLSWQETIINETVIDINNLEINFDYNETYVTGDLEGLTVLPPKDPINATFFQFESFFNIAENLYESPVKRERLQIIVEGGSNVTHAVILHRPETVPPPDETSPDMRTMVWYNQSISSLKDLIFEIQIQSYGITVTTSDQSGNPVPNAIVNVRWPNGTLWKTLSTGEYGFTSTFNVDYAYMPLGAYNITATYQGVSRTQHYTIDHTGTYTISLPVNSPQIVINITNPAVVTPTNPVTGDATQNAAAILTIKQISEPVTIAVRNVAAPTGAPPPSTWKVLGNYVQIIANETTITVNATLRIYYTPDQLAAAGLDEGSLKINYWNSTLGQWGSVQGQVNTAGHYVEAVITHFSVWTIMGQPGAAPMWTQPWFLGIIVGIMILIAAAAAYVTVKKKPLQQTTKK